MRRVHAVEPLYSGAARWWNLVPLPRRSEAIARHFIDSAANSGASTNLPSSAGDESAMANGAARKRSVTMSDLIEGAVGRVMAHRIQIEIPHGL